VFVCGSGDESGREEKREGTGHTTELVCVYVHSGGKGERRRSGFVKGRVKKRGTGQKTRALPGQGRRLGERRGGLTGRCGLLLALACCVAQLQSDVKHPTKSARALLPALVKSRRGARAARALALSLPFVPQDDDGLMYIYRVLPALLSLPASSSNQAQYM
jgi:hypothetical protein